MLMIVSLLLSMSGIQTVAQLPPPSPSPTTLASPPSPAVPASPATVETLNNGPCLDSPRAVPLALQSPVSRNQQIMRIDKVVSDQSNLQYEVIGYLYTLQDGTTWLGQRTPDYMSAADARAINQVLALTHAPDETITEFPPVKRYGVSTRSREYFRVQITQPALDVLRASIDPCVAWPPGRPLPDPSM
jgi:hypothetical protein